LFNFVFYILITFISYLPSDYCGNVSLTISVADGAMPGGGTMHGNFIIT